MDRGRAPQLSVVVSLGRLLAGCVVALAILPQAVTASPVERPSARQVFVPVLALHHVKWDKPGDDAIELGLTIHPAQFRQELAFLASHHYRLVNARQLVGALRNGAQLPRHPVVLTFDDGYADMYTNVYPLLRRRHMTATFFVIPGLIGKPRYLTWAEVVAMDRHGMDIESHSMTHPDLTAVPAAQAWGEISRSRRVLESRLHHPVHVFAYPYGAYNAHVLADVRKAGYWGAFTTHQGWWQRQGRLASLPRVYVDRDDTIHIFAGRLTGDPAVLAEDPS